MSRSRRHSRFPQDLNILALLVVLAATVLAVLDKVEAESVLLLLTGLAIPAKTGGYTHAEHGAGPGDA